MKRPSFIRIAASLLVAVMMLTSSPATVFAEDLLDSSDSGIITEVDEVTDLTDEDVEFLPSGEDDLPEISETPDQPEIPDPEPEDPEMSEPESQPEFDPEARILAAMLDTGAREIQQITTHWEYTYYHAFQQKEAPWATATIGGVSMILYGMISAVGVRNVVENRVDLTKSRNLIIAAVIFVSGLGFNSVGGITFTVGSADITLTGLAIAALAGVVLNAILPGNDYEFGASVAGDKSADLGSY